MSGLAARIPGGIGWTVMSLATIRAHPRWIRVGGRVWERISYFLFGPMPPSHALALGTNGGLLSFLYLALVVSRLKEGIRYAMQLTYSKPALAHDTCTSSHPAPKLMNAVSIYFLSHIVFWAKSAPTGKHTSQPAMARSGKQNLCDPPSATLPSVPA